MPNADRHISEQGTSTVEFALILPVLVLLFCGIIELAAMYYDNTIITYASQQGARMLSIYYDEDHRDTDPYTECTTAVNNSAGGLITFTHGADPGPQIVTNPASGTLISPGDLVDVTVSYRYDFLFVNLIPAWTNAGITLSNTSTMRAE